MRRLTLVFTLATAVAAQEAPPRPDIVVVLADDLGWSDVGCYGSEIRTPNLDGLAHNGLRFTQFYNTGRCCPTRASLLTGQYPHRAGVGHMMEDRGHDGYRGELNDRCVTIAEVLRMSGYATCMTGKWHVTHNVRADGPKHAWPLQRGFDSFFGTIHGAGNYFEPVTLTEGNAPADKVGDGFYVTDAIADRAAAFVKAQPKDQPFFLYVAFTAPHWPLHARPEDIAAVRGRYDEGWDALRTARHARQKELGLVDPAWDLTDRDHRAPPWDSAPHQEWQRRRMEVYAAQVECMDRGIGRIVATLRTAGRLERTLFLFLADNGGCAEELGDGKSLSYHTRTHDGRPVHRGNDPAVMPGPEDTYQSYGLPWANASNTPFRLYKHYVHEGGISSPLIVHWPDGFAARGELRADPGHVIDVMATCLEVSGAAHPIERDGHQVEKPAGTSLWPAFRGEPLAPRALFFEHEGNRAVRFGRHKLVARGERGNWELYDLEADRTETRDRAGTHPELAAELAAMWRDWAMSHDVLPLHGRAPEVLSTEQHFELRHGDDLPKAKAPNLAGRSFALRVRARLDGDGVLVAQGGSSHGFALYRQDGRLCFGVRRDGELSVVQSADRVSDGEVELTVEVRDNGTVTARAADREILRGEVAGLLTAMPSDGLQVGSDKGGAVGSYAAPFPLAGEVLELVLEVAR